MFYLGYKWRSWMEFRKEKYKIINIDVSFIRWVKVIRFIYNVGFNNYENVVWDLVE